MLVPCAQQTAATAIRIMGTMAADFAVCQICLKNTVDAEIDDNTIVASVETDQKCISILTVRDAIVSSQFVFGAHS